ncbi:MAG TPA: alpha/beta fold hydrolase [Jiangellales bacterium]|nr:alpha/beta fold hydrolase [Jiangellales bacterium]
MALQTRRGLTIRGWFIPGPSIEPQRPAALVVHGWGGSAIDMQPVAQPLLAAGLDVLLLDARCHGRSDDDDFTSMPAFAEDVQTALRWLGSQPNIDPTRVVLLGHSVGAGACLLVAARDETVAAVVCLASMADPRMFMARTLRSRLPGPLTTMALRFIEHTIGHPFEEFAPVRTIRHVRGPVLLLHGALDDTIPVSDAYQLRAHAPAGSSLIVLPDADHFSVDALDRIAPEIRRFLLAAGVLTTPD